MPLAELQDCRACGKCILLTESFRMVPGAWFHLSHYDPAAQLIPQQIITATPRTTANDAAINHVLTPGV